MKDQIPYDLLAKYFARECTEEEKLLIENWQKESTENKEVFFRYAEIWRHSDTKNSGFSPDISNALGRVNQKIDQKEKTTQLPVKGKRILYYVLRIAAILILSIGIWFGYEQIRRPVNEFVEVYSDNDFLEHRLPDGTIVTLNLASYIKYSRNFNEKTRNVELEGEAYFEVAKDPERPFIITAQQSVTRVVGTAFNLKAKSDENEIVITVTEGIVEFSRDLTTENELVELIAGERAVLNKKNSSITKEKNEDFNFDAWKTRKLTFKNTPVNKAMKDMSEFYNVPFLLESNILDSMPLTLEIPANTQIKEAINAIEFITTLKINKTDTGYLVQNSPKE